MKFTRATPHVRYIIFKGFIVYNRNTHTRKNGTKLSAYSNSKVESRSS